MYQSGIVIPYLSSAGDFTELDCVVETNHLVYILIFCDSNSRKTVWKVDKSVHWRDFALLLMLLPATDVMEEKVAVFTTRNKSNFLSAHGSDFRYLC